MQRNQLMQCDIIVRNSRFTEFGDSIQSALAAALNAAKKRFPDVTPHSVVIKPTSLLKAVTEPRCGTVH